MHIESLYYVLGLIAVIYATARSQQRYARHKERDPATRRHKAFLAEIERARIADLPWFERVIVKDHSPLVDLTIFGLFMWGAVAFFRWLG